MQTADTPLLIAERPAANGCVLGVLTLNVESSLNSLTLEMIRAMTKALGNWRSRDDLVAVVLNGRGPKAFCAGGDIQALYRSCVANQQARSQVDDYARCFFSEEYQLDLLMHQYPKPIVTLGHGVVMGGGFGLFSASRFRVLTERSRLAFPEITIGLFPDAGGSWVLKNMPLTVAAFLGLTGSQLNARDALNLGIGSHVVDHGTRDDLVPQLAELKWNARSNEANVGLLESFLATVQTSVADLESELEAVPEWTVQLGDLASTTAALFALQGQSNWIDRGLENLRKGCPTTAAIVLEQLHRVQNMTLAESFAMELEIATRCAQLPDFPEGVRALLIDKDGQPNWRYKDFSQVPRAHVLSHFGSG
jgi:enoyl-CoA hydratase/carnithine racemase